jgi:Cof subfamily protein (haloacid dehalogenase superfamily)
MTVPIICFDLDGTLLDRNGKIHPKDIEIFKSRRDVMFIPCTGRPLDSVEHMFHDNGLFRNETTPFPAITQNGSAIHLPGGEIYQYNSFPKPVQDKLIKTFQLFPQVSFMLMEKARTLLVRPNDYGIHWMERFNANWEPFDESNKNQIFGKATCISDSRKIFEDLSEHLKSLPLEIGISLSSIFDINPEGISKRSGVLSLLKHLHLEDASIYAAGDGENDLDLFTLANVSFSPVTSPAHVKEQSTHIVDTTRDGLLTSILAAAGCL